MLSVSHSLRSISSSGACQLGPRVSSIVNTPQALSPYAPLSPAIAVAVRPAQPITTPPGRPSGGVEDPHRSDCSGPERGRKHSGQYDEESQDQQQCRGPLPKYPFAV